MTKKARVMRVPSGRHEVLKGVFVTVDWESETNVTEKRIYVNGAEQPSVILKPIKAARR